MTFHCVDCNQDKPIQVDGGTGYATLPSGDRVCYSCIAVRDRAAMIEQGQSSSLPLYLTGKSIHKRNDGTWAVTNWPNTLSFPVQRITKAGTISLAGATTFGFTVQTDTSGMACSTATIPR
jgi:hypothetical protein